MRFPKAVGKSFHHYQYVLRSKKIGNAYMHKCCGYENACSEMLTGEEDFGRNLHPLDLLCNHREARAYKCY